MRDKKFINTLALIELACQQISDFDKSSQDIWREINKARDILYSKLSNKQIQQSEKLQDKIYSQLQ